MGVRRLIPLAVAGLAVLAGCTATPAAPATHPPSMPASPAAAAVERLLARPLKVPTIAPGAPCPTSPATSRSPVAQPADGAGLGTAPLYPISFYLGPDATLELRGTTPAADGLYELKVVWASTTGYVGPVVVRVGRLDGAGRGRVEQLYHADASRGDAVVFELTDFPQDWPSLTRVSATGCWAYQVDGLTFSEVMVFRVVE
jgi:hypothetical protein